MVTTAEKKPLAGLYRAIAAVVVGIMVVAPGVFTDNYIIMSAGFAIVFSGVLAMTAIVVYAIANTSFLSEAGGDEDGPRRPRTPTPPPPKPGGLIKDREPSGLSLDELISSVTMDTAQW